MENIPWPVNQYFTIVQTIPESLETDTVTVVIRRVSDGYTWNFSTLAFQASAASGSMTWDYDIFWKQGFTPPTAGVYQILINNTTLDVKHTQIIVAVAAADYPAAVLTRTSTSDIAICNLALAHLGQDSITSLADENASARNLSAIYEITRDVVLRIKDWRFANVKIPLAEISLTDEQVVPGWVYAYAYPAKCLCLRKVFDDIETMNAPTVEFEEVFIPAINQKAIVCNVEDAYAEFTYQITDATLFDMAFVNAFSFLLAAQVAKPLTGDDEIAKTMLQIYGALISDAARVNDGERYIKPNQTSSFEDSR